MRVLFHTALTLVALTIGIACAGSNETAHRPNSQLPIRTQTLLVYSDSRSDFLAQIESIAKTHEMDYRAAQVTPDAVFWIAEMVNSDFRVIVANDLKAEQYDLTAYGNETDPVPDDQLDQFLGEIESAVRAIPGVTVLEHEDAVQKAH